MAEAGGRRQREVAAGGPGGWGRVLLAQRAVLIGLLCCAGPEPPSAFGS